MSTSPHTHPALAGLGTGRCFVIGEVALTHDGSLGLAHAFIDAIAAAGADAVKFQTHIAAAESTPEEPWRVRFSPRAERMSWPALCSTAVRWPRIDALAPREPTCARRAWVSRYDSAPLPKSAR